MKDKYPNLFRAVFCAGTVIAVTACSAGEKEAVPGLSPAPEKQIPAPEGEVSAAPMDIGAQTEFSRKDLAQRLGIELDSVTVSGARPVDWRSGALAGPSRWWSAPGPSCRPSPSEAI